MKKRLLALFLAVICLINAAPFSVFATEIEDTEFVSDAVVSVVAEEPAAENTEAATEATEEVTETTPEPEVTAPSVSCGENLTWTLGEDGTLTISGNGYMNDYGSRTATPWYANADSIISIVIEEGVLNIGDNAFALCRNLVDVTIFADSILIGAESFADCPALESISFEGDAPEGICADSFNNVTASVNYPAGNTTWTEDMQKDFGGSLTWHAYCPNGHSYVTVTTPVTCTSDGYTTYTCSNCSDSYTDNRIAATGHSFVNGVCSNCDLTFEAPVLSVTNTKAGKIKLTWTPVEGATGYKVLRSVSQDGPFEVRCTATGTSYTNSSAALGETYYYAVIAVAADGTQSTRSNIVSGTYSLTTPSVTASNDAATGKIKLTWDKIDSAAAYEVYASSDNGATYAQVATVTDTTFINNDAIIGVYYHHYVVAVTEHGARSDPSNLVGCNCILPAPAVTVSNIESSGKIRITWTPVEGAVKYQLYRSTSKKGTYTHIYTTTKTFCTNVSIEAGVTYYYKVKAIAENPDADSSFSAIKGRTCDLPRPVVTISNNADTGKVWITWKPVEGAVKYQVYCSTSKNGPYNRILTTTGTICKHNSADAGATYYYRVRAVASESSATSAYSPAKARVTDLARPEITAMSGPTGKPLVTWEPVEGAVQYKVYRAESAEGPYKLKYTTTGTTYTNSGASIGRTFYYRVRAVTSVSAATSAPSVEASAKAVTNVYNYVYSSYSTTKYSSAARNTNLVLSCKAINGTILAPGEQFSFNEIVGPRTEKKGYLIAGQTGGGEGRGGGICQVSTTLFNAALLGNLKITKRYQHSEAITYAPRGRDAMLYASKCDFRFVNDSDYYIKVQAKASNGTVTITFLTRESGVSPKSDVDLIVTHDNGTYTLTRYYMGVPNYTAKSTY